jgi:hypothetical protein
VCSSSSRLMEFLLSPNRCFFLICSSKPCTTILYPRTHNICLMKSFDSYHPKIARHTRNPMINAATTPTIPMIMSKFEPLLFLRMFSSSLHLIYKDHSGILAYSNRWFCYIVIFRRTDFAIITLSISQYGLVWP